MANLELEIAIQSKTLYCMPIIFFGRNLFFCTVYIYIYIRYHQIILFQRSNVEAEVFSLKLLYVLSRRLYTNV